jgi:hypothetical protein
LPVKNGRGKSFPHLQFLSSRTSNITSDKFPKDIPGIEDRLKIVLNGVYEHPATGYGNQSRDTAKAEFEGVVPDDVAIF